MNQINLVNNLTSSNFISKFGMYSNPYPYVSSDGSATWHVMLFIVGGIFFLIGGNIMLFSSVEKEKINYLLFIIGILFITGGTFLGLEGSIRYIWEYLPQFNQWYQSLPEEGVQAYLTMKAIQSVLSKIEK